MGHTELQEPCPWSLHPYPSHVCHILKNMTRNRQQWQARKAWRARKWQQEGERAEIRKSHEESDR